MIRKGSKMSVTANCFALTPRVSLNACRRAKTCINWLNCFLQPERSSCGTAQLLSRGHQGRDGDTIAGLRCHLTYGPFCNVRIVQWQNESSSWSAVAASPGPRVLVGLAVHAVIRGLTCSRSRRGPWRRTHGWKGRCRCSDVPSRVDPAAVDKGPFNPLRHGSASVPNCLPEERSMLRRVVRPRARKRSIERCPVPPWT